MGRQSGKRRREKKTTWQIPEAIVPCFCSFYTVVAFYIVKQTKGSVDEESLYRWHSTYVYNRVSITGRECSGVNLFSFTFLLRYNWFTMLCLFQVCSKMIQLWKNSQIVMSDSAIPWIVACPTPLSMEFPRQEYWSGLPFPSPGDLPNLGIKPESPAWQVNSLSSEPPCWCPILGLPAFKTVRNKVLLFVSCPVSVIAAWVD